MADFKKPSKTTANLQQTLQQVHTHISEEKTERKKRKETPEENSKGGSPGTLLPHSPAECAKWIQDTNAVDPSTLSPFAFSSCRRFDFPQKFHVRRAQVLFLQRKPSMGTIPRLFTGQKCFRGLCWPPLCYFASKTAACLSHKAARLNSLRFTKCLETTEQKSVGFKQQKTCLKTKSTANTVTSRNYVVS